MTSRRTLKHVNVNRGVSVAGKEARSRKKPQTVNAVLCRRILPLSRRFNPVPATNESSDYGRRKAAVIAFSSLQSTPAFFHSSRMRLSIASLLVLGVLSACATAPRVPSPAAPRIVVERDSERGYWRATYELTEPVGELRFERNTPFRKDVFEVLTDGFAIERDGETEVLRTTEAPAQRIVVRFPEYTRELEKEYDFFQKFTDGSVAIYTGHLVAQAGNAADPIRRFRFVPPAGEHVVAGGTVAKGPAEWVDGEGEGAYIYIGSIVPIETRELVSIVDPGLPQWLWEETRTALPRLFDFYANRLGTSQRERPLVMFNSVDRGASGYSYGGGTLPGQIQLTVDGSAWTERSDEALLQLLHFLAHETAHLWNGRVIRYDGSEDAWMHEGSAEAMTERALRELAYLDDAKYSAAQSEAFNECRRKLGSFPLRDAAKRNAFPLYYTCGNALSLFTENTIASRDLFDFWKTLIARVRASGRTTFDASDYYAAMTASGASEDDVAQVQKFVAESATADALADLLRRKGLRLTEAPPSRSWGQSVSRDALLRLLTEQCTSSYGFTTVEAGFAMTKTNSCGPLPGGGTVRAIGGHDVLSDGAAAWNELHERCGSSLPVRVDVAMEGAVNAIEVQCRNAVAGLPTYLRIELSAR